MPAFDRRSNEPEVMDDLDAAQTTLRRTLHELRLVNQYLGGHATSLKAFTTLSWPADRPLRVLDVGTGGADFPEALVRWADRTGRAVHVDAVDLNAEALRCAEHDLDAHLPPYLRRCIDLKVGDALSVDGTYDVAHASLFLHHLSDEDAARLLARLRERAPVVVINDLHRHPLAYASIRALGQLGGATAMFRHDGPLSVLRAFRREELLTLAQRAGLTPEVSWHWAFRWLLVAR